MRAFVLACLIATLAAGEPAGDALVPLGVAATPLSDATCAVELTLAGALARPPGKDGKAPPRGDVTVRVQRVAGVWAPGTVIAPAGRHDADASKVTIAGDRLGGTLVVTLREDAKAGGGERRIELALDGALAALAPPGPPPLDDPFSSRFWVVMPEAQSETRAVTGTWRGDGNGALSGRVVRAEVPGAWNMGRAEANGGLALAFELGTRRLNWNFARLAIHPLAKPRDLRASAGLRLRVTTAAPRADVQPSLWLREEDGSWWYVKSAVPLVDADNVAVLRWQDFSEAEWVSPTSHMDEDYALDRSAISHVAVGLVDGLGRGPVAFTVAAIDVVGGSEALPPSARVAVSGKLLDINGTTLVPPGIFGGYAPDLAQSLRPGCQRSLVGPAACDAPKGSEAFHIDCWFDRYSTATLLTSASWKEDFAKWGAEYAAKAKALKAKGQVAPCVLEFWNEPYLNWSNQSRKNFNPRFFNVEQAAEGAPVVVMYGKDGARTPGPTIPHFQWKKGAAGWEVVDTTQFTFWSGRGCGWIYDQMFAALGPAVKQANPEVKLIAGWGFRWHEDRWAAWDLLYKPTIDRGIQWIDGIHEHHYQGDTTAMNGSYELLTAYGVTAHRKWLTSWNTETNDLVDAPARGRVDTPEKAKAASHYRKMIYNLRDCLYAVAQSPDKHVARTVIHAGDKDGPLPWAKAAYGFLQDLRGRLVEWSSSDDQVWCASAIDGTDPQAGPAPRPNQTLVVALFNNHRLPVEVQVTVAAPAGTAFASAHAQRTVVDIATWQCGLADEKAAAAGASASFTVRLDARAAWKVALPLTTPIDTKAPAQVKRRQHFSADLLKPVRRGAPFATLVKLDQSVLPAKRAWLRLVIEDVSPGEGVVRVGDQRFDLPAAMTADNNNRIVEIPLDAAKVGAEVPVEFTVTAGNHAGYQVDVVSVVTE